MMQSWTIGSSRAARFGLGVALLVCVATLALSWMQARSLRTLSMEDLDRRAMLLAHRAAPAALRALDGAESAQEQLRERLGGHGRLLGLAVIDAQGSLLAGAPELADRAADLRLKAREAAPGQTHPAALLPVPEGLVHVVERTLVDDAGVVRGSVIVAHDATYVDERFVMGMLRGVAWSLALGVLVLALTSAAAWAIFELPLHRLSEWMRRLRVGNTTEAPPERIPVRTLADETARLAASFRASRARDQQEAQALVRSDRVWTQERLRAHALAALGGRTLVVVSNREPYMHRFADGAPRCVRPASGLVTGLDPVLRACGGLWVAHGAGDADRATCDGGDCVSVPPEDPRYTLRRVWLSKQEEQGYYYGFSNEGLWPLCHLTHERPIFRAIDWEQYRAANQRFADAVLEEIGTERAVVLVQDYQLALVPSMLKERRPDLLVGLFWHIPWPNSEVFRICPYAADIVRGMLGADLLGFHLQQHCNNFLDTVDRTVAARLDWDRFAVELEGHVAQVRPFPISVQGWQERNAPSGPEIGVAMVEARRQLGLGDAMVGVGVDRIDYTKGIAERFRAIDRLFEAHPQLRGQFSFVQLGAPSRTHIPRYRELVAELERLADEINWRHQSDGWKPIHFLVDHHDERRVFTFLRLADVCVVSSLHDGMNLVAKEFIAAQAVTGDNTLPPGDGVLVLSEFAGAARDLPEALIVNPYDTEQFAAALHRAITMDAKERRSRMTRLRVRVEENNIYRWAADFMSALAEARPGTKVQAPTP